VFGGLVAVGRLYAGVVEEDVDAAEHRDGLAHDVLRRVGSRHIRWNNPHVRRRSAARSHAFACIRIEIGERHAIPCAGKRKHGSLTYSMRAARDDHDFLFGILGHLAKPTMPITAML
jgi:hypothetical protein